jgi:hypothetical protein
VGDVAAVGGIGNSRGRDVTVVADDVTQQQSYHGGTVAVVEEVGGASTVKEGAVRTHRVYGLFGFHKKTTQARVYELWASVLERHETGFKRARTHVHTHLTSNQTHFPVSTTKAIKNFISAITKRKRKQRETIPVLH